MERFDWKHFLKAVAAIATPIALQNLLTTTGSMVDTMMLAPLGSMVVGAAGLCAQLSSLMFSCYWGFVGGGMLFFSQCYGARDDGGVKRAYGLMLSCMMVVAVLFATAATRFPTAIMRLYTDKPSIQEIGVEYLRVVGWAYPLQILSMAMSALLRSTGRVRIPMFAAIGSLLTNVSLNFVLIQGRFGFPALGIRGAAVATVASAAVNLLVIAALALAVKHPYTFAFRDHFRWNRAAVKQYFIKCAPIIANELLIGIGFMVINIVLGRQSEQAIAATAVFRTLEGFVIAFFSGFSNASSVLVGKEVGAGNLHRAYAYAIRVVYLCGVGILLACLALLSAHRPLLTAMSLTGESYDIGFRMLCVYSVAAVIRMCNWTQNDTCRAGGDAAKATILEIVFMYLMVLPSVCLSAFVFKAPFMVVFSLCYVDEPIRFVLMQRHMYSGRWIKPVTPQGRAALAEFMESRGKTRR